MARESGPTIACWQLGAQLKSLREAAGITQIQIAEVLGCSESKIYKLESGDVSVGRGDLLVMLDRYNVAEESYRATILDLQSQGRQRGWWSRFGTLPHNYSMYVGLEGAAVSVRNFELAVVPGLLQTEEYAHAVISASRPNDPHETEKRLRLRIERQKCLTDDQPLMYWTIIDEGVLHRMTGGRKVMREQLDHLTAMNERDNVTIQVLPYEEGWHPGTLGAFNILDFSEGVHSPVVYTETLGGDVYLERRDEVDRVTLVYTHLRAAALSASKSRDLIAATARGLT
nr:helix-turn-helix transcriptional regulator [Micromonospora sp. DSM 115978]